MSALPLPRVYVSTVPRVNPLPRCVYPRVTAHTDPCCQRSEVNEEESMLLHLQTEENKPKCETNLLLQGFIFLLERGHIYFEAFQQSLAFLWGRHHLISLVNLAPIHPEWERMHTLKWKRFVLFWSEDPVQLRERCLYTVKEKKKKKLRLIHPFCCQVMFAGDM